MSGRSGIVVDSELGGPLYRQIVSQVIARIDSGAWPGGHRLPPSRDLAKELGSHRNTVVRAYDDLEQAGYVYSEVGRGTFVAHQRPPPKTPKSAVSWSALVAQAATAEPLGRFDRLAGVVTSGDVVNLTGMQPSEDLLPVAQLRRCLERVLSELGGKALAYAPRDGVPRLREIIATRLCARGVPAQTRDIVITTGSQQALDLVARALIDPGDVFLVDAATYSGALNVLAAAGARLIGVPNDGEGPDPDALERLSRAGAKGLYLMPNCHNPTGRTITAWRRHLLVGWSQRTGVPLVEDDFAAELDLIDEGPPAALRALDGDVIYVGTFSKKLIPALRVGYLVCPPPLRPRLVRLKHAMDLGTSTLLQHALAEFIERGYLDNHLAESLPTYRERCDALVAALEQDLPESLRFVRPSRGVGLWLPLPASLEPEQVFEEARRAGVLVSPSTLHAVSGIGQPGLRLTFCLETPDRLRLGAKRLSTSLVALLARGRGTVTTLDVV